MNRNQAPIAKRATDALLASHDYVVQLERELQGARQKLSLYSEFKSLIPTAANIVESLEEPAAENVARTEHELAYAKAILKHLRAYVDRELCGECKGIGNTKTLDTGDDDLRFETCVACGGKGIKE